MTTTALELDQGSPGARVLTRRNVERGLSVLSPILLLLLWELGATVGWIDTRFFPAPSAIFKEAEGI